MKFRYWNRRLFAIGLLGFASGVPLALVGSTLQAWFAVNNIDLITIGLLSFISQPYTLKFLWAPLFDRFHLPFLDYRRGWLLCTQLILFLLIAWLATLNPVTQAFQIAIVALLVAIGSASQDIVYDAYRTELLHADERGLGAAVGIAGYRLGMIFSGGIALIIANHYGWKLTFGFMAASYLIAMIVTCYAPALKKPIQAQPKKILGSLVEPLRDFFQRPRAVTILLFIFFYKLGESYTSTSSSLVTTFLLQDLQFSLETVGWVNKVVGVLATIGGLFLGGAILTRMTLYRALWIFGVLQAFTNAGFIVLAWAGKSMSLLIMVVTLDNISAGMGLSALIALLMSLCRPAYTATQFALLSALAALPRIIAGPSTSLIVGSVGWFWFFVFSVVITFPALFTLRRLEGPITAHVAARSAPNFDKNPATN